MDLKKWIDDSEDRRRKTDYYLSLGYSEHAAAVLSSVTYGDDMLVFLVKQIGGTSVIENLYQWLSEREEISPDEAILAYYSEKHHRPKFSGGPRFSAVMGSIEAAPCSAPFADVMSGLESDDEESFAAPSMACSAPTAAPHGNPGVHTRKLAVALSTDEYESIEEKSAKSVFTSPTSTFRMTTSNASMGIVMNQLRSGRRVSMDQVRIEEVLNYFDYDAPAPTDAKFRIRTELLEKKKNKKLLYINVQAAREKKDRQNIVLLLDTSGSMTSNDEVTQAAIATVFSKLAPGDRISLVTYSSKDHMYLEGFEIRADADKEHLMGVVLGIGIEGCTYGSAGIRTAYDIGAKYFDTAQNNQVILITDGDLNFGITDKRGLKGLIEDKKQSRLFLSVIGTGLYNYKDDNLEVLAKHGNGTYCVVNSLEDVDESINRRFLSLTNIVAKDVKAQVEFNPRFVRSYRLLGYENRQLSHEDYSNDAVISEPYGSGGHGIALYELEMNAGDTDASSGLKYQTPVLTDSEELGTVSVRYKEPLGDRSYPIEAVICQTDQGTRDARLAYLLYCLSEKLRGSDKLDEYDEQYLDVMLTSGLYRDFPGPNGEKLETLVEAYRRGASSAEDEDDDFLF